MSKKNTEQTDADPTYLAKYKYATISARKVRLFADLIRGKYADEAVDILACYPNRGARMLEKVLQSAIHNAQDRNAPNFGELLVVEVRVDGGPSFRRWKAKSRGMSTVIKKSMSHITVVLG
ncbi:MAG: 50S ribosomal protein L22 [Thermoguttaceae bacterium]|nr:50S ribosomal protein L22 [Thermoguttaceae bacterium]